MTSLVVDIETVPLAASLNAPYPEGDRSPPGNYKLPEAIEKWRTSDKAKWAYDRAKECSINPRLGRVLCIGMRGVDETGDWLVPYATTEADEAAVLTAFWDRVDKADGKVVTWNGHWDLRFLVIRSLANGIKPTLPPRMIRDWFRKYTLDPHFDCKAALLNWDVKVSGEGLDEWSSFFGLPGKTGGMSGGEVYGAYKDGRHQDIADYCVGDVKATLAIYQRIAPMFG